MKNKLIGVIALSAIAASAQAASFADAPYVGVEAIQTNQDFKNGFGKKVFKKNPMDYSVFGGFKFHKQFGVEAGYEFQPNKNNRPLLGAGDRIPGAPSALTSAARVESAYQTRHTYLGLFGEHKVAQRLKLQGLIAFSVSHVKARTGVLTSGGATLTLAQYASFVAKYSKTKVVPMAKVSATYMVTDHVGLRASATYRNMSAFKIKAASENAQEIRLKDSWGAGLGVTYNFCK